MKRQRAIREGDWVRIVDPRVVVRVGYPKAVADYIEAARAKYGAMLAQDMTTRCVDKALHEIAYGLAKSDGFGGRERSLHFQNAPELMGQEFIVTGTRMVQTGTYYPPSYYVNSWGEGDGEPGGLEGMKARRLLTGFQRGLVAGVFARDIASEIPVEHVERFDP